MASSLPYVPAQFKLSAEIGGIKFDDIVAISATFGLNSIPTATLTVAVGYRADSGGKIKATIHDAKNKLRPRDKAVVTLTITTGANPDKKMETGTFVIFEGMLAGIGYQRAQNNANYTIQLVHWLDELNNSSALNGNWFPGAPHAMATNAAFYALDMSEGGVGAGDPEDKWSSVPTIDTYSDVINKGNVEEDFWGKVIKPLFEKIADYPLPDAADNSNKAALTALSRMPGSAPAVPLPLDLSGLDSLDIELSIKTALAKDLCDSFAYTSFWGKLIGEYAPQFFFAVSPGIEHAVAIPFFAGLRWQEGKGLKIEADEYSYANFNATMTQLLEAVMVFWPAATDNMLNMGGEVDTTADFTFPVATYPAIDGTNKPGLKLFKEPPAWLSNVSPWPVFSGATTGIKGKQPGDCLAPQTGEKNPPPDWLPPSKAAEELQSSEVCTRFAHHWYKTEFLSQRYGELSGKLRFDIAPGSIVRIEMPIKEIGSDGYMIAAVNQVSYSINAERALAGTSFALSYVRTEKEDEDEKITHASAPLYKGNTGWFGGSLKNPKV